MVPTISPKNWKILHGTQDDTGRSISPTTNLLQLRMKIKLVNIVTAGITQKKAKKLYFDCGPTLSQHKTLSSYQTLYLISLGTAFTISLVQLCITDLSCIVNLLLGTLRSNSVNVQSQCSLNFTHVPLSLERSSVHFRLLY